MRWFGGIVDLAQISRLLKMKAKEVRSLHSSNFLLQRSQVSYFLQLAAAAAQRLQPSSVTKTSEPTNRQKFASQTCRERQSSTNERPSNCPVAPLLNGGDDDSRVPGNSDVQYENAVLILGVGVGTSLRLTNHEPARQIKTSTDYLPTARDTEMCACNGGDNSVGYAGYYSLVIIAGGRC
jgi:hypothetical protein